MAEFQIHDSDLTSLKDQVVVITGASSGIGLATTELLLSLGARVVGGDRQPSPLQHPQLTSVSTDVTVWSDIIALFDTAKTTHGRVDHVFANAGIAALPPRSLVPTLDPSTGTLREPVYPVLDVNLVGCMNTAYVGLYHLQHQHALSASGNGSGKASGARTGGGSIVCTASAASLQSVGSMDYAVSKHGVLGFVRGVAAELAAAAAGRGETAESVDAGIRINAVAPSWTHTGMITRAAAEAAGLRAQSPVVVARNVALFMADPQRCGQVVYSVEGRYLEVEETVLRPAVHAFVGDDSEQEGFLRLREWYRAKVKRGEVSAGEGT